MSCPQITLVSSPIHRVLAHIREFDEFGVFVYIWLLLSLPLALKQVDYAVVNRW